MDIHKVEGLTIEEFLEWQKDYLPTNRRNNAVCHNFRIVEGDRIHYLFNACGTSKGVGSCKYENINKMFIFEKL
jgi:hypothetical protein